MKHRHKHIQHKLRGLKPKKHIFKMPVFWIALLLLMIMTGVVYVVLFFPKFQIANIQVSGNEKITTEEIKNIVQTNINQSLFSKSMFVFDTKNTTERIKNRFPGVESVDMQKKWPQDVMVIIKERKPFAVFCRNEETQPCFSIDEHGVIFEPFEGNLQDTLVITQESNNKELFAGQHAITKNIIDTILKVRKNLQDNVQIDIKKVLVSSPEINPLPQETMIIFTTSEHWQIYINQALDINTQITKMNLLLKDEITPAIRKNLKYIYLQYQDRAYYK